MPAEPSPSDAAGSHRTDRAWAGVLGVAIVLTAVHQVRWAILPAPTTIMGRAVADDGFYYLVLAQHAPRPWFAADVLTTGFHPLWWLLLAGPAHILHGFALVRFALALGLALHLASAVLLYRALRVRRPASVAAIAASLWVVLPGVRALALIGVEAPLLGFALAALLLAIERTRERADARAAALVGALVGVCYLARTDSIVVTVPLAAAWAWGRRGAVAPVVRRRSLGALAGGALVVAAPWLAYLATRGSLLASDAARAERRGSTWAGFVAVEHRVPLQALWLNGVDDLSTRFGQRPLHWLLLALVLLAVAALVAERPRGTVALVGIGATAVLYVLYGAVGGYLREWYLLYLQFALCAFAVPALVRSVREPFRVAIAALVLPALLLVPNRALHPNEADKYRVARAASVLLPADARIGAFNAGIYQWAMRQDVVNLDGVVNPDVQAPLRAGHLCRYLAAHRIDHLIDAEGYLERARAADPSLRFTATTDLSARVGLPPDAERQLLVDVDLAACR